jgi:hypothetical protein
MDKYEKQFEKAIRAELPNIAEEPLAKLIKFCQAVQDLLEYGDADYIVGGVLQWGPSLYRIYSTPIDTDDWIMLTMQAENAFYKD